MLPFAQARGMRVVFAVYPARPLQAPRTAAQVNAFAAFTAHLARTFPSVKEFIVGNEPNQTRFWQPQFGANGGACVAFTRVLAASYDALKGVDRANRVIGVGLSPRGNDDPRAKDNVSHSPVSCLRDMGAAYRGLARARPLMDELSFHPYPKSDRDPLMKGYRWPNAGVPNLGRIKQAFWDAFRGTRQPLFAEGGARRRRQVPPRRGGLAGGRPPERPARVRRRREHPADRRELAGADLRPADPLPRLRPSVSSLLFFGLVDEPDLGRWQAGLIRADGTLRPAYGAVKGTFAQTQGRCAGKIHSWRHTATVLGAKAKFPSMGRFKPAKNRYWAFNATAAGERALPGRHLPRRDEPEGDREAARPRRRPAPPEGHGEGVLDAADQVPRPHAPAGPLRLRPPPRRPNEPVAHGHVHEPAVSRRPPEPPLEA